MTRWMTALPIGLALTLVATTPCATAAQPPEVQARQPRRDTAPAQDQRQAPPAPALPEKTEVTRHTVRIGGQPVAYTATTGTLLLPDEQGKPIASMFYVFYSRDTVADLARRPILYSFNGGPGTASVWMHMGFTGPRRVVYDEAGFMLRPPFRLTDNEHSILDIADIVFIDPVGTGYSRMAPGEDPHKFHGVTEDITAMGDFIRLFTGRHGRWKSPKYLIGESYGTTRASGLVNDLQSRHQMFFNGVILVSMTNLGLERGDDLGFATRLPHQTATAWYHTQLPPDLQGKPLKDVLAEAERFVMSDYQLALAKGGLIPAAEREAIAKQVARLTGLSAEFVLQNNLRVDMGRFRKELLRDRGLTVGRLDSRYTGTDRDAAGESIEFDPAMEAWNGPFGATVNDYLRSELKWDTDDKYYVWGNVRPWRQDPQTRVGELLRGAMTRNPYLEVLVLEGYYDGATDYFSAQYTMSHLDTSGSLSKRIHFAFYESGHMMYVSTAALAQAKRDLAAFVQATAQEAVGATQ